MHRRHVYASKLLTWLMESSFIIRKRNEKERVEDVQTSLLTYRTQNGTNKHSTKHPCDDKTAYSTTKYRRSRNSVNGWRSPGRRRIVSKNTCREAAAGFEQESTGGEEAAPENKGKKKQNKTLDSWFLMLWEEELQSWISGCWWMPLKAKRKPASSFFLVESESASSIARLQFLKA